MLSGSRDESGSRPLASREQRNVYKESRLRQFLVTRDHVKLVCTVY